MLKAIVLLFFSFSAFANAEYATYSLQRFQDKIVVSINHDKDWHTYWKNPGDAGIASSFKFIKNDKPLEVKSFEWPTPKRYIEAGDISTIGYGGIQHFFFENISGTFTAKIGVLICKDICIPGESELTLKTGADYISSRPQVPYSDGELTKAFENLPVEAALPSGFEYYLTREKGQPLLTLHYSLKDFKNPKLSKELNLLTAFPHSPWGFKRESLYIQDGVLYGKTEIEWDGEYQEPELPLPEDGKFAQPYDLKFLLNAPDTDDVGVVSLKIENFSLAAPTLKDFYKGLTPFDGQKVLASATTGTDGTTLLQYLFFAFLGGLILNLMPCVLPVISLKLFGLIKHKSLPQRKILAHNLSYTAGVISTFMALALVIALIKAGGEEIGWGFQLQSPAFILVMMIILFVLSLNLFGLFEFRTPGGAKFGSQEIKEGVSGDFFSGILTTILSTPCSAPFLGTALTFAFTTTNFNIFLMFFFIGLGLDLPFPTYGDFPSIAWDFPSPRCLDGKTKVLPGSFFGYYRHLAL